MANEPATEASNSPSPATSCGSYPATVCSAVKVDRVWIGELPPEIGPAGNRLIVLLADKRWLSVDIDLQMDNIELAKSLRLLADGITQNPTREPRAAE